jgi:hypothetical protein
MLMSSTQPPLTLSQVVQLRRAASPTGGAAQLQLADLLHACASSPIDDAAVLVEFHDTLLFMCAYPRSQALKRACEQALVACAASAMPLAHSARGRRHLQGSGLPWSRTAVAFSLPIARWLVRRWRELSRIDSVAEGGRELPQLVRHIWSPVEGESLSVTDGTLALLEDCGCPEESRLSWLVQQLDALDVPDTLRDDLYDSLQVFVRIDLAASGLTRSRLRGPTVRVHLHDGRSARPADLAAQLRRPLPGAKSIDKAIRQQLIDTARAILAVVGRETDPISLCDVRNVEYLELGRGVCIALYSAVPGRRFALDSHVGFLLFKNAVPVAYGGGWPFLGLCKIGVNIFPAFRGGESAYLFAEVLRVYAQCFSVQTFEVEPYQFGGGNAEGLQSGAFWFYYRLGFRPVEPRIAQLADQEFARVCADRAYRSPRPVLRRLARCNIRLPFEPGASALAHCDAATLSVAVSQWIAQEFAGDRQKAQRHALARVRRALGVPAQPPWPACEWRAFCDFAPLLAMVDDLDGWSAREKADCVALLRAKGAAPERHYFERMAVHTRFRAAMEALARRSS